MYYISLLQTSIMSSPTPIMVDTLQTLVACLAEVQSSPPPSSVAVDLEGVNLGRSGRVAIIQLYAEGSDTVWLVDITTLGAAAFDQTDANGNSLRSLLEGTSVRKVRSNTYISPLLLLIALAKMFWDVRNDSDALYSHFNVRLQNTFDLQILELAVRRSKLQRTKFVCGLGKGMDSYGLSTPAWIRVKESGVALFAPEKGGSYEVFETRPLSDALKMYCAQDVSLTFQLEQKMRSQAGRVGLVSDAIILRESAKRVTLSQGLVYNGKGRHMAEANVQWY